MPSVRPNSSCGPDVSSVEARTYSARRAVGVIAADIGTCSVEPSVSSLPTNKCRVSRASSRSKISTVLSARTGEPTSSTSKQVSTGHCEDEEPQPSSDTNMSSSACSQPQGAKGKHIRVVTAPNY